MGGASCCGDYRVVQDFATKYIQSLDAHGTVSVVQFADRAKLIASPGDAESAISQIASEPYTGGFTNTEEAIELCAKQVKNLDNPVVVLITDGTPTACTTAWNRNRKHIFMSDCSDNRCDDCFHGPPRDAAENRADWAAGEGVTVVPVVVSSVSEDTEFLEDLARCPEDDSNPNCDVDNFKDKLHVENTQDIDNVLLSLTQLTGCEDE